MTRIKYTSLRTQMIRWVMALVPLLIAAYLQAQCEHTIATNEFDDLLTLSSNGTSDLGSANTYICSETNADVTASGGNVWVESDAIIRFQGSTNHLYANAGSTIIINEGDHAIFATKGSKVIVHAGNVSYLGQCGAEIEVLGGSVSITHENQFDVKGIDEVVVCGSVHFYFDNAPALYIHLGPNLDLEPSEFPYTLSAANFGGPYEWSTGSTSSQITIYTAGTYWVKIPSSCGSAKGMITFTDLGSNPELDLGETLKICQDELPYSIGMHGFSHYEWSTGETSESIEVTSAGTYHLQGTTACGALQDSVVVEIIYQPEDQFLGDDMLLCAIDFPLLLEPSFDGFDYQWGNGTQANTFNAEGPGTYTLALSNQCGAFTDEIVLDWEVGSFSHEAFYLCPGASVEFVDITYTEAGIYFQEVPPAQNGDCTHLIQIDIVPVQVEDAIVNRDLEDGRYLDYKGERFYQPGTYNLTIQTAEGCDQEVTLIVTLIQPRDLPIYVPTAFTPDGDGFNETFKPVFGTSLRPQLTHFEFKIYNSRGKLLFKTNDPRGYGWNGKSGVSSEYYEKDSVYPWEIVYSTGSQASRKKIKGSVTLLR